MTVLAAAVSLVAMADNAWAFPSYGIATCSMSGCHTAAKSAGTVTGNTGTANPAGGSGTLKSFNVLPGATLPVTFNVPSSVGTYAVALEQLGNAGIGGKASPFSADPTWTASGTGYYYSGPKTATGNSTFNLTVAAGATPDVYTLLFYSAGNSPGLWSQNEKFYVNVIPEPATLSLLALGGVALLKRMRRRA